MPIGAHIRGILEHNPGFEAPADPFDLQRMFVIDRAQDIVCNIAPALAQGKVVLYDRYALSTLAYGIASAPPSLAEDTAYRFLKLHRHVIGDLMVWPDVTYLIDITADEAMQRLEHERVAPQHFEKREKLERIIDAYHWLYDHWGYLDLPGEIVRIDGMQPNSSVGTFIVNDLMTRVR